MELLQKARLIDPTQGIDRPTDILLDDNRIKAIAPQIQDYPDNTQVVAGESLIVGAGLVDLYSHSQEPGNEARESIEQLLQGAVAGGFTQIGILPDTTPKIDHIEMVRAIAQKAKSCSGNSLPQLHLWGRATADGKMNELAELRSGVVGFCDRFNLSQLTLFKQLLEYLQPWQKTIAIAIDRNELAGDGVIREGAASIRYGMSGNPGFSEAAIIAAVLEIVAEIPTPVHIMRVSTQRGVELIANAKQKNIPITASTTWMHLLKNNEATGDYDPNLRLEPPLGNPEDRMALIAGIKQGIIDAIAFDHCAYTYEEKTVPFGLAPPGALGLEFALPVLWQELVATEQLSALELWQALSTNASLCLGQKPTEVTAASQANLILFDPQKTWIANRENLKSPAANSIYCDREITGKVIKTIGS